MKQQQALEIVNKLKKIAIKTRDFNMVEGLFQWGELNGRKYSLKQKKAIVRLQIRYKDDLEMLE